MIDLYSGTPGSGKSLHVASIIRDRITLNKRIVIGNFTVNLKALKRKKGNFIYIDNMRLTPDRLIKFSFFMQKHLKRRLREGELLLIIDESQLLFNSREWGKSDRGLWLSFFSQHRKLGFDVILIAQNDRMLDRQIRSLIEYQYIHRKVSNAGYIGKFLGFLFGNSLFVYIKQWYPLKEKVGSEFFKGSKRLYAFYDSFTIFST